MGFHWVLPFCTFNKRSLLVWWWPLAVETCSHSVINRIHYLLYWCCCVQTLYNILYVCKFFFFHVAQAINSGLCRLIFEVSRSPTIRHTHSERVISSSQRPLLTQPTINTREIRDPSEQGASELYHGHRHVFA